jgi:hypothetical protein
MENPYLESRMAVAAGAIFLVVMVSSENRFSPSRTMPESGATLAQSRRLGNAKSLSK